jgi:hypothetical protein
LLTPEFNCGGRFDGRREQRVEYDAD